MKVLLLLDTCCLTELGSHRNTFGCSVCLEQFSTNAVSGDGGRGLGGKRGKAAVGWGGERIGPWCGVGLKVKFGATDGVPEFRAGLATCTVALC